MITIESLREAGCSSAGDGRTARDQWGAGRVHTLLTRVARRPARFACPGDPGTTATEAALAGVLEALGAGDRPLAVARAGWLVRGSEAERLVRWLGADTPARKRLTRAA